MQSDDATSLISIVLSGSITPRRSQAPAQFAMPALARRPSDSQIADVVTFAHSSRGNHAPAVDANRLRALRPKDRVAKANRTGH